MKRRAHMYRENFAKDGARYLAGLYVNGQSFRRWREAARAAIASIAAGADNQLAMIERLGERSVGLGIPIAPLRRYGSSVRKFRLTVPMRTGCNEIVVQLPQDIDTVKDALSKFASALQRT